VALAFLQRHPRSVGTYDVLSCLAKGGIGSVYKGRHRQTGRVVAIKLMAAKFAGNPALQQRFEQEFRVASELDHPNVARALDFGHEGDSAFLVMEFVEGQSLGDHIERKGKLKETGAVRVITQVAQALHLAHQRGLIHRDIKPDNVLLRHDGLVKVTDFGLVKDLSEDHNLTNMDTGLGTPHFMAPEQYQNAKSASVQCDIYSLGATLYNAVTGEIPFGSCGTINALISKINGDITPPRKLVPELSEEVDYAIRRAMSPKPERRPASCLEFVQDLVGKHGRHVAVPAGEGSADRRRFLQGTLCRIDTSLQGGAEGDTWPAVICDLSRDKVGLLLARRFEPGTVLTIGLHEPRQSGPSTKSVKVTRVDRQSLGHWFLGCSFVGA
jgi:serine/threonine protein kinase